MPDCRVIGCFLGVSLVPNEGGDDGLCWYHAKCKAGLIYPDDRVVRRMFGLRGLGKVPTLRGIGANADLGDEALELYRLFDVLDPRLPKVQLSEAALTPA